MNDILYVLIDDLSNGTYGYNIIKNEYNLNNKSLLKTLYKVLHIAVEDHFNYKTYPSDLVFNTLKAIEELSNIVKLNNEETLRIERKKIEEINYVKSLRVTEEDKNNKEFKKIISKLENITIYPTNMSKYINNNNDFIYLVNNEADIYTIKCYLFENNNRIREIKKDESIINLLCEKFVNNYNSKSEKMYYYLYILKLLHPDKLSNTKIKKIYKDIVKDTTYHDALKTFNLVLNGKEISDNEENILELYNIKNAYRDSIKTINVHGINNNVNNISNSITIDPQKTSNVKDDSLSIDKTRNEYIYKVHISNVGEILTENDIEILRKRFSSIYLPNMLIDMIKENNIKNTLSLDRGKNKNVITLTAIFSKSGLLKDYYFNKEVTKIIGNYTYDEVDKILLRGKKDDNSKLLFNLYEITNILKNTTKDKNKYRDIKESEKASELNSFYEYDTISHGIVEEAMVLYNSLIAEYQHNYDYPFVYRNHEILTTDYNIPIGVKKYFNSNIGTSYYDTKALGHAGLNLSYYSHASAPMRRCPDAVNQQLWLNPNSYSDKELDKIVKDFNEKEKTLKLVRDEYISSLHRNRKF